MRTSAIVRIAEMVPVLAGVSVLVFSLIHLVPGDPAVIMAGMEASPESVARTRRELGLDQPLVEQYWRFVTRAAAGDLGVSIRTRQPVLTEILERAPHTLAIATGAMLAAVVLGILLGAAAALFHNRAWDTWTTILSLLAVSMPSYWLALMLMLVFSLALGLLPAIGVGTRWHYVLPGVALGAQATGLIARMTRAALLEVLHQEFIVAARARGLGRAAVIFRHALPNALVPVVSIVGLRFGGLLAGAVLVESVFAIPGLGRLVVDAVLARDYPMVQGSLLVVAAMFIVVNAATDLAYMAVDPRVRRTS
jgi:ABC-type dipeptide/oligopeptide/nickel transport system permease component